MNKSTAIAGTVSSFIGLGVGLGLRRLGVRKLYSYGAGLAIPTAVMVGSVVRNRSTKQPSKPNTSDPTVEPKKLSCSEFKALLRDYGADGQALSAALDRLPAADALLMEMRLSPEVLGTAFRHKPAVLFYLHGQKPPSFIWTVEDFHFATPSTDRFLNMLRYDIAHAQARTYVEFLSLLLGKDEITTQGWTITNRGQLPDPAQGMEVTGGVTISKAGGRNVFLYWEKPDTDRSIDSVPRAPHVKLYGCKDKNIDEDDLVYISYTLDELRFGGTTNLVNEVAKKMGVSLVTPTLGVHHQEPSSGPKKLSLSEFKALLKQYGKPGAALVAALDKLPASDTLSVVVHLKPEEARREFGTTPMVSFYLGDEQDPSFVWSVGDFAKATRSESKMESRFCNMLEFDLAIARAATYMEFLTFYLSRALSDQKWIMTRDNHFPKPLEDMEVVDGVRISPPQGRTAFLYWETPTTREPEKSSLPSLGDKLTLYSRNPADPLRPGTIWSEYDIGWLRFHGRAGLVEGLHGRHLV